MLNIVSLIVSVLLLMSAFFFFSSRRRHTRSSTVSGLGDVYKRQHLAAAVAQFPGIRRVDRSVVFFAIRIRHDAKVSACLLYTSDAADERSSVDLGGRRIIKKTKESRHHVTAKP